MKHTLGILMLLITACAVDKGVWTTERLASAVDACKIRLTRSQVPDDTAQTYCACYFDIVKARWKHDEYSDNPGEIDQTLETERTEVASCEAAAGI